MRFFDFQFVPLFLGKRLQKVQGDLRGIFQKIVGIFDKNVVSAEGGPAVYDIKYFPENNP